MGNREMLATFHPKLFGSAVIKVRVPGEKNVGTFQLRNFLRTHCSLQDTR